MNIRRFSLAALIILAMMLSGCTDIFPGGTPEPTKNPVEIKAEKYSACLETLDKFMETFFPVPEELYDAPDEYWQKALSYTSADINTAKNEVYRFTGLYATTENEKKAVSAIMNYIVRNMKFSSDIDHCIPNRQMDSLNITFTITLPRGAVIFNTFSNNGILEELADDFDNKWPETEKAIGRSFEPTEMTYTLSFIHSKQSETGYVLNSNLNNFIESMMMCY